MGSGQLPPPSMTEKETLGILNAGCLNILAQSELLKKV